MDSIDRKLLALLSDDGRASLKQLAGAVQLSRTAVTERLRKLERSGEIAGYTIRRPAAGSTALLLVKTNGSVCELLVPRLKAFPEILSMRSLAGEIDILLEVETREADRLNVIREEIAGWAEVNMITTAPVLKVHWDKQAD